jgi:ligand-binding sensor domain-containing protein
MRRSIVAAIIAVLLLLAGCGLPTAAPAPSETAVVARDTAPPASTPSATATAAAEGTPAGAPATGTPTAVAAPATATPSATTTMAASLHLVTPAEGLPAGEIRNLWASPGGKLWVASAAGIFAASEGGWVGLHDGPADRLLGADAEGRVWAVVEDGAAIAAHEPSGTWKLYGADEGWTPLPAPDYLSPGPGDGLVTDPQGRVWWATGQDDLRRFDPQSQTWELFTAADLGFDPPEEEGYQGHFLTDVALSPDGDVWVADCIGMGEVYQGQGIRFTDGSGWSPLPFTAGECVLDIEVDATGRVWVGAFDALLRYDAAAASWSRLPLPPWERRQLVVNITLDAQGNPWVEAMRYGGASPLGDVARYHLENGAWTVDFVGWFSNLAFGTGGEAWLCSEGSIYRLEGGEPQQVGSVPGSDCEIAIDGDGRVWVTDHTGLWWLENGS